MKKVYKAPNRKVRTSALAVCLLLTAIITVGGTLAYIFTQTDPVTNTFNPVNVGNNIHEVLNGSKKDVKIQNTGSTDAYIRVKTAVAWQDADGNIVHVDAPIEGIDYEVNYLKSSNWELGADGYWYYKLAVAPNDFTDILIEEAVLTLDKATPPAGYTLHMEIISQAIQSTPDTAVDVWDSDKVEVTGRNGVLTVADKTSSTVG